MSRDLCVPGPLAWSEPGRTTREIKTGGWRTQQPRHVERPAPCRLACPAGEPIPAWIERAQAGDFRAAWNLIREENPFPAVLGRICAHPCESACNRGPYDGAVAINDLERAVGDWGLLHGSVDPPPIRREERVAVVGGGPAGLSCAYHLARLGYRVSLYEASADLGGLLRHGIPEYRLPRRVLDREIELVLGLGVGAVTGVSLGETIPWEALACHQAVFLATGASRPVRLGLPGERAEGICDAPSFLREVNAGRRPPLGERVVVIGGGSTAMDAARTAVRLGARVTVVALEARERMPADVEEVEQALAEGVTILNGAGVEEIVSRDSSVAWVRVRPARLSVTEGGTVEPAFTGASSALLRADSLLLALGQQLDPTRLPRGLRLDQARLAVGEAGATSRRGVFAGGDLIPGPRSVAHAVGSGTVAARAIHRFLNAIPLAPSSSLAPVAFSEINLDAFPRMARAERSQRPVDERVVSFAEVVHGLTEPRARGEARRCFSCGTCTACDRCLIFCPDVAIRRVDSRYEVLGDYCKGCGLCARECPRGALVMAAERA
jgi:NADPH-dependent glutamate synthase beta subunit-like oxidoreductase/Pyruvate/2-oxoacid:ferredoxin oxidoreductase delta subunit